MSDPPKSTFARRVRAVKPRGKRYDIRDDVIPGLSLRVFPSDARRFALARMARGRRRYATIGDADAMTIPEARAEARRLIAAFTETVKNDGGPRTPGHPMDAFAAEFLDRQARHWKPRTLASNAYMVRKYLLPTFGHLTVDAIAVEHVKDWFASMAEQPGSANRALPVLSTMMRRAELWGYRRHNTAGTTPIRARTPSDTGWSRRPGASPPRRWPGSTPCSPATSSIAPKPSPSSAC